MTRTYSRADFLAAKEAWRDYDDEWSFHRAMAADRGMLYPPSGTRWDDIDDPKPSQRAIVYRAMTDTPLALTEAIQSSSSWSQVVAKLLVDITHRREDADLGEREAAFHKEGRQFSVRDLHHVGELLNVIRDSVA